MRRTWSKSSWGRSLSPSLVTSLVVFMTTLGCTGREYAAEKKKIFDSRENFILTSILSGQATGMDCEVSCLKKVNSFLFDQHNLMQWSKINDWDDVSLNTKDLLKRMFQGYLLLRGLHQREDVLKARKGTKKSVLVTICVLNIQKEPKQYSP